MSHSTESIFTRIRESCAAVCAEAEFVHIQAERVAEYAASLPLERLGLDGLDPATHLLGQGEQTLVYILALDSINFGSGYFTHLAKRPGMSGYFTVAAGLKDWFAAEGPITAEKLAQLTLEDCRRIFGQSAENAAASELMAMFSQALRQLGVLARDEFHGSFERLTADADGQAAQLIEIVCRMPYFLDRQDYKGRTVEFFKRAQILCADLHLAFDGEGPGRFEDIARLTSFADNLVPHVLWVDGLLRYSPALIEKIDDGELLLPGSPEEVELRAAAVHGVELLRDELARQGTDVSSMRLDFLLWNRGQAAQYKSLPRHRTRTVYY